MEKPVRVRKTSVRLRKTSVSEQYTYYQKHPHITKPSETHALQKLKRVSYRKLILSSNHSVIARQDRMRLALQNFTNTILCLETE
jgi:thiamine biosynthesis lipoprotein ApbE